jgi:CPA2 family monovalent cation:H+ antiporter-2
MPLVTTMAAAFGVAWVLGIAAQRLRLSPIVGYLLAGVLIGPHTPGLRADVSLASQLAEIGVVLLMFGVGLHFRVRDLREVGRLAIPGALVQSTVATLLGLGIGLAFGWPVGSGLVLGMALSVASTVVLLRGLEAHNLTTTPAGHAAIGWLIVEDILTVLVLVVIPVLGQARASGTPDGPEPSLAAGVAPRVRQAGGARGRGLRSAQRLLPRALVYVARLQSRELFTLTILAIAIAIAAGARCCSARRWRSAPSSPAWSWGSRRQPASRGPTRCRCATPSARLFFVSVGMLFEPSSCCASHSAAGVARGGPDRQTAAPRSWWSRCSATRCARRSSWRSASRRWASSRSSSATRRASRGCSRTGASACSSPARSSRSR